MQSVTSKVELRDVAPGLWIWRAEHHHWKPGDDWQPIVTSTYVESGGERFVIDPLVPKTTAPELWKRLDDRPPTMAAVTILTMCGRLTGSSAGTMFVLSVRDFSGLTMCPRPSWRSSNRTECFPEAWSASTMDEDASRHRYGYPSSE